jgi:hypothetical protein
MTRKGLAAFAMVAMLGVGVRVEARTPCQEYLRLRNAAAQAWGQAMRARPSERCGAFYHASLALEATLKYADNNRESCDISAEQLNQLEGYRRQRYRLAKMLAPDALCDHFRQTSSHAEIIGSPRWNVPLHGTQGGK